MTRFYRQVYDQDNPVATPVPPLLNEEQFTALIDCMEAIVMSAADCAVDPSAEIDKLRELIATPTVSVRRVDK